MGIFDFFRKFREKKMSEREVSVAMDAVKQAAQAGDLNDAVIKAFYAVETMGKVYRNIERQEAQTAREYVGTLLEEIKAPSDDVMPLVYTFEVAKYSPDQVTAEQFLKADEALKLLQTKLKASSNAQSKRKGDRPRQRKRKGGSTARRKTQARGRRRQGGD